MRDAPRVQMLYGEGQLVTVQFSNGLREVSTFIAGDAVEEFSSLRQLHDDEDAVTCVQHVPEPHDTRLQPLLLLLTLH